MREIKILKLSCSFQSTGVGYTKISDAKILGRIELNLKIILTEVRIARKQRNAQDSPLHTEACSVM